MRLGTLGGLTASLVLVSLTAMAQDTTPPVGRGVIDGILQDREVQDYDFLLEAKWTHFEDPESPIANYAAAVGTAPGCADVEPFKSVDLDTEAYWFYSNGTLRKLLKPGTRYFITVRATNSAGLNGYASSNGVLITLPDGGLPPGTDGGVPACPTPDGGTSDGGVDGGLPDPEPNPDAGQEPGQHEPPLGWSCGATGGFSTAALLLLGALGLLRGRQER